MLKNSCDVLSQIDCETDAGKSRTRSGTRCQRLLQVQVVVYPTQLKSRQRHNYIANGVPNAKHLLLPAFSHPKVTTGKLSEPFRVTMEVAICNL